MLTDMAQHAYEMVRRERKSLNSAKKMLTKFRGDGTWIPCGLLYSEDDEKIFDTTRLYPNAVSDSPPDGSNIYAAQGTINSSVSSESSLGRRSSPKIERDVGLVNGIANGSRHDPVTKSGSNGKQTSTNGVPQSDIPTGGASSEPIRKGANKEDDVEMAESRGEGTANQEPVSEDPDEADGSIEDEIFGIVGPDVAMTGQELPENPLKEGQEFRPTNGVNGANLIEVQRPRAGEVFENEAGLIEGAGDASNANEGEEEVVEDNGESRPPPRRMRTRAQAQAASEPAASSRTETPDAWVAPEIHPLFLIPATAITDRDYGLPSSEAEETRRLLMAYVQKQEEIVRGAEKLYEGLMQAERQRKTVFKWCKAEGHVGEMSDGEDWYDKEEWGLEDELRKGHLEEEEDTVVAGKKTRGRRA